MALVTLYMSDRDPQKTLFTSKKEADAHDKKLELAESICEFLQTNIAELSDESADQIAMLIADHKDLFLTALKGRPDLLNANASEE